MTPQQIQQVREIFSRIVELPHAQWADAVEAACGSDAVMRAEVESLLEHADPPPAFLSTPILGADFSLHAAVEPEDDLAGRRIGPYRVTQRWASGGMGAVYLASRADGQFEQQVAIKVVKRGMDSEEILRRFAQERRTLAALTHPNIARLLDGGAMPDGRPYLVMEYVKGVAIDQYCDEHCLTITQRLRLFCVVCEALRFAHQKLVVHRDLKPSNILVDETGAPKLLDFGISKVLVGTGTAEVTALEQRRFTPEYASPEQVAGQPLSTATDVYSLGVILYELLSGHRPYRFETRTAPEVERVVCGHEPIAPSAVVILSEAKNPTPGTPGGLSDGNVKMLRSAQHDKSPRSRPAGGTYSLARLRRRLSGDLDTIVLKAMHKDPARRYASVEQFAADIERHLDGLPVLARPDTVPYRLNKFVRRHTIGVAFAAGAVAILTGGFGVATWQASVARRQRDAAYLARDQAEATTDFFQRMLAAADPANEGPDARVRTVLDAAAMNVDADLKGQPLLQAAIRSTIGRTYLGLGLLPQSEEHIRAAYDMRSSLLDPSDHDMAESEFDLAHLLYTQGDFAQAETLLNRSLATHQRLRGAENLDTARVWNDLGAVRRAAGKIDEAEHALRRALEIREKLAGRESLDVAESLNNLAGVLRAKGDFAGAEKAMTEVLETRRRLLRDEHPLVVQSIANLAVMVAGHGDLARGEELLRQAVGLDRKVFGERHPSLAVDLSGLGRVLLMQKRFTEAEPFLREAYDIRRESLPTDEDRLLKTQAVLGECLVGQGRDAEAAPLLADAVEKVRGRLQPGEPYWLTVVQALEDLYRRLGRGEDAAELASLRSALSKMD